MGVEYAVFPLSEVAEYKDDPKIIEWLEAGSINLPPDPTASRYPTIAEIRSVLDNLSGYTSTYYGFDTLSGYGENATRYFWDVGVFREGENFSSASLSVRLAVHGRERGRG